jgi:hypothetical protein
MNAFLSSVKDDLLDVRLRLLVVILAAGLVAAVAFAVLGGGGSSATAPVSTGPVSSGFAGIAISQAPTNALQPVSETTGGTAGHRGGALRDPFTPLSPPTTASAATSTPAPSSSSTTTASSGSGSSTSGSSTPAPAPTPTPPAKTKVTIHYRVTAAFGVLPAPSIEGGSSAPAQLKTYANMRLDEPLPDKNNAQLVFLGVVLRTGSEAVFALTGESILHGNGTCVPSPTQCQAIRLRAGQVETLESVDANGSPISYELKLISIARVVTSASAARAHVATAGRASRGGREVLASDGLVTVSGLQYSPSDGALVTVGRPAFGAHAAAAFRRPRHGR